MNKFCFVAIIGMWLTSAPSDQHRNHSLDQEFFVNEIFEKYGNKNVLTYEGFEHLLENLGLGKLQFEKSHSVSLHKINGSFYDLHDETKWHHHSHDETESIRSKRHTSSTQTKRPHSSDAEEVGRTACLSTQEILESYGLEPTHGLVISQSGFLHICPAIVYELDQKHCWPSEEFTGDSVRSARTQVWLEASASILIMSVAGLLCAGIVPILNRTKRDEVLQLLIAVAAGTLLGDALIHLLPQVLHPDPLDPHSKTPLLRATFSLLSMVIMFVVETIIQVFRTQGSTNDGQSNEDEEKNMIKQPEEHGHSHEGRGTLACAVIAGDVLHNITDGLSIGAAFSSGQGAGLACAVAVFCHELPHELGDYAVLLREGMGMRRAIMFNLVSSVFSLVGMAVGIVLGEVLHAAPWINAFTAGTFIYIALVHLIPDLRKSNKIGEVLSQTIGLVCGVILMFFIGLYEDKFEAILTSNSR